MKELKPWTNHEEHYLKTHYPERTHVQIAMHLRRSVDSVRWKTHEMGLKTDKRQFWTPSEIRYLEANHGKQSYREMAEVLGRGINAVRSMCNRLDRAMINSQSSIKTPCLRTSIP